jgi:hypothetical protein
VLGAKRFTFNLSYIEELFLERVNQIHLEKLSAENEQNYLTALELVVNMCENEGNR